MQTNTICVAKNNIDPKPQILVNLSDVNSEADDTNTLVDYDTLSAAEKTQFDDCVAMILSKIPA